MVAGVAVTHALSRPLIQWVVMHTNNTYNQGKAIIRLQITVKLFPFQAPDRIRLQKIKGASMFDHILVILSTKCTYILHILITVLWLVARKHILDNQH